MKTKLIIHPREGINNIRLGMDREMVHAEVGMPSKSFLKFQDDPNMSEEYKSLGVFIYYDREDRVKAIEAWNEAQLFYDNVDLFNMKYKNAISFFKEKDPDLKVLSDGFISQKLGINTWFEEEINENSRFTSVTIFKEGF